MLAVAQQFQGHVLELRTDIFQLVVFHILQHLAPQFLLTDSQQELGLLDELLVGIGNLLCEQTVRAQYLPVLFQQVDGFLPELYVRFYIPLDDRVGRTGTAALGTHRLFGIQDSVMFQFCPGAQHCIQRFLVPFGRQHEIRRMLWLLCHRLQCTHPLRSRILFPFDLAHAFLHTLQVGGILAPTPGLVQFLHKDLLSCVDTHCRKDIQALWDGTLGGCGIIVHHLLQHFGVRLIALRHQAHLVTSCAQELRADTCLFFRDFIDFLA